MIYRNPLQRLYNASIYSLNGLAYALKNEQAFRYEFIVFCVLCIILCFVPIDLMSCLFLAAMWLIVMALELVNSAAEKAFDLIDKNFRPEIKAGKDMLSAAIFIMTCLNIFIWLIFIFIWLKNYFAV